MDQTDLVVLRVFITLSLSQAVLCSSDGGNSIATLQKRIETSVVEHAFVG